MAVFLVQKNQEYRSRAAAVAETNPQTTWAACTNGGMYTPLSDSAAAALVTRQPEDRPKNATPFTINGVSYPGANSSVPTAAEIAAFQQATNQWNETQLVSNPYSKYITGNSTLQNPSSDDLIQWAAHKWGIPEDWLRAQYVHESNWNQFGMGDLADLSLEKDYSTTTSGVTASATTVSNWYTSEPIQSKMSAPAFANPPYPQVYESLGITQLKWRPNRTGASGTEPIRWKSTAFNIDYQASAVRFYFDDPGGKRTSWGDTSYVRCQDWNSIGAWFSPYPWGNSPQQSYISSVQTILNNRTWETPTFINQTVAYPSVITFDTAATPTPTPTLSVLTPTPIPPTPTPSPVSTDTTHPSVIIVSPSNGSIVSRGTSVTITASASDNVGVTKVEFYINNVLKTPADTTYPYTYTWNVPSKPNVTYALKAVAYDAANNSTASSVTVTAR
ncbi:MAG TPA: Ig-like domain-containing protein [Candidatus Saccharimonadales bacterium]|nr:Ig-like domain-containing protein [Candidatus Saccharimonadales bacterium]